ncbi:DUF5675 family protein [Aliiglaciecola sp. CAU 1673]|uniref:DUF5675 family protein n=1 Tax=Aliiglaciecola sp. CAU 1673 TaxID=3032595 RepID=UPI0023DCC0ED|nr:DUF5675 family protein [Aliiglaciecola sp. CAU 1673]MDF2178373.1 DUF5675 family protein [Aliiglaciecola sp. CAU 1673]
MLQAYLIRDDIGPDCIRGMLYAEGELFHVLERPWLNNKPNQSCICAGRYEVDFLARSGSGKYRDVYWLQDVPGRSGILIHKGNIVAHSTGCLILGKRRGKLGGQRAVLNSHTAMQEFVELMNKQAFSLQILGSQSC